MRWFTFSWLLLGVVTVHAQNSARDESALRKAVTFYASFDETVAGDFGGGRLELRTRSGKPQDKDTWVYRDGFPKDVFRIAKGKGIAGGALEAVDVLPDNGRIFFPAKGNLAFKKGGWGGAVSMWINTDPNKLLKTTFCDPIQITQKGANNGGLWVDFNNAKPRDLRMGVFPAVPEGEKGLAESDAHAPMVCVPAVKMKEGEWHHVVLSWENLDTGKANARAVLYIDAKQIGAVENRAIAMDWDIDKTGIYVAVNYIGLLDELAIFNRALSVEEVMQLQRQPGMVGDMIRNKSK